MKSSQKNKRVRNQRKPGAVQGRPSAEIDFEFLERLCEYPLKRDQVAHILGISHDTLERYIKKNYGDTFASFSAKRSGGRRLKLLDTMFNTAIRGNPTMQIFLAKNWLKFNDGQDAATDDTPESVTYLTEWGHAPSED